MLFCDLLRVSVLLVAGVATALGAVSVVVANQDTNEFALALAAGWWIVAAAIGVWLGRPERARDAVARLLAGARTATSLPPESPGRIAFMRLWPIGAFALLVGIAGIVRAADRRDRRRLRDPDRARLARPRGRRRRDRGPRRRPLLRRALLGLRAGQAAAHPGALPRAHRGREAAATAPRRGRLGRRRRARGRPAPGCSRGRGGGGRRSSRRPPRPARRRRRAPGRSAGRRPRRASRRSGRRSGSSRGRRPSTAPSPGRASRGWRRAAGSS